MRNHSNIYDAYRDVIKTGYLGQMLGEMIITPAVIKSSFQIAAEKALSTTPFLVTLPKDEFIKFLEEHGFDLATNKLTRICERTIGSNVIEFAKSKSIGILVPKEWKDIDTAFLRHISDAVLFVNNELRFFTSIDKLEDFDKSSVCVNYQVSIENIDSLEPNITNLRYVHNIATSSNSCITGNIEKVKKWLFKFISVDVPPIVHSRISGIIKNINKEIRRQDLRLWSESIISPQFEPQPLTREMLEDCKQAIMKQSIVPEASGFSHPETSGFSQMMIGKYDPIGMREIYGKTIPIITVPGVKSILIP